jgi:uncharacterized membrane protein
VSETPTPTPPTTTGGTVDEGRLFAFLAYLLWLVGFFIVLIAKKDNKFAMFHAKQSLVLCIVGIASGVLHAIPFFGTLVALVLGLVLTIFWIMGMIYALTGQETNLPIVGDLAAKINL